ncbi:MAG TPA: hypothetical protein VI279_13915, partial [Rhodocyclaceae bacterium]
MERRTLLRALVAAGLAPQLIRVALAKGNNPVPAGLHKVEGKVTLNGSPAREGQLVKPGDTVKTGANSSAIYVIGQDAFLQRADSEVHFPIESLEAFLRVLNGKLLSVFGRGQKKLQVSTATIGIRGTACYIEAEASKTYFCLCYGEAEVVPSVAPAQREIIHTEHHDHPIYIHNDPKMATSMVPAAVINHNDAELTLLENLVGRRPAFYGKDYK